MFANHLLEQSRSLADQATEQASAIAQRGVNSVRDTSHRLRAKALHASHSTVSYIKDEPVKAALIAVATGAALMAIVSLLGHWRDRR